jgi:DNA-binding NarL/FixJ family response regulator
VLEQLSTGLPYTAIAENLYISPSTVRRHIENIYQKLQVHSKTEAIPVQKVHTLVYKNVAQRDGQWQLDEAKVFQ